MHMQAASRPFHLMAKPAGPACNLACAYCFYISRWDGKVRGMDEATLERFIISYIAADPADEVTFGWQGGEPTLMGLDFFRRTVALQKRHCPPGKRIQNAIQTNGTLLDDEWCAFLREEGFLVGLSVDGPAKLHDRTRVDRGGKPTAERVRAAAELLVRNRVEFNVLCVVGSHNMHAPLQVYRFLRRLGSQFIQFIPIVERRDSGKPHDFAAPEADRPGVPLDPVSITPEAWSRFLIGVFDAWITCDVGRIYIRDFDNWLGMWTGLPSSLCIHSGTCGDAMAVEADGSVYSCDHFVYPAYRLGRMGEQSLAEMVESPQQRKFGTDKRDALPHKCLDCRWRKLCHGGCPKHRFPAERGAPPAPHLCAGWIAFFEHAAPGFEAMASLLAKQQPPALVMSDRSALRRLGVAQ